MTETEYEILPPIRLGQTEIGQRRKKALEELAAEADCYWGGKPSIGKYLIMIADERIEKTMTVKLSESGYDTGLTFDEVCELIENEGQLSPREVGHTPDETTFVGSEYAKSSGLLDDGEIWGDAPYWYARQTVDIGADADTSAPAAEE